MMFVHNVQINNRDRTYGWYTPSPASPPSGKCGTPALEHDAHKCVMFTNSNFTKTDPAVQALFGITACPAHFDEPTLLDLGTPVPNSGFTEIRKFQKTPDLDDLHELFHLVSHGGTFV